MADVGARLDAVLFDMDGVVTDSAEAHAAAWKRAFDEFFAQRAGMTGETLPPFDARDEYRRYVDGKPRYDGVASLLSARHIDLPFGSEDDPPDRLTVCGIGNRKNLYFHDWLDRHGAKTFPATLRLVGDLRRAGIKTAVFSASRNAAAVLRSAGVIDLFDARVDGDQLIARHLPGKPHPAMLLETAQRLGVAPGRAAVVEDAIAGVEAGVRGGFGLVVGINRGRYGDALRRAGADLVVDHVGELHLTQAGGLAIKTLATLPLFRDRTAELDDRIAGKSVAAFFDYDGALTPIVADYRKALLSPDMRAALAALAAHVPVAVVSGRDVEVLRRLVGLDSLYYAGSHGFEIVGPAHWRDSLEKGAEFLPELDEAERRLRRRLAHVAGHAVERKRFAVAVHYRGVAEAGVPEVEQAVRDVLAGLRGLRMGLGKKVFRVQPDIDWDKGRAVAWLLARLKLDRPDVVPVYAGDDITDEDAFRAMVGRGISLVVRDGEDRPTAADYALGGVDDVQGFLEFLTTASTRSKREKKEHG